VSLVTACDTATLFVGLAGMAGPFFQHLWDAQLFLRISRERVFQPQASLRIGGENAILHGQEFNEVSPRSKHCSKTVVVPCSERVILGQIGATSTSGNLLRKIVE
jgi:hypothetical protein